MKPEEEIKQLREALSYAVHALALIPVICMVPTCYFDQITKVIDRVNELTPKPQEEKII
jgi:uncharacterized protein YybS (DUF2232 family)